MDTSLVTRSGMSMTQGTRHAHEAKQVARLALVAMVGTVYWIASVVALHLLRPDYDPAQRAISEFAVGPYGYLMTIAFILSGVGSFALTLGLWYGETLCPGPGSGWPCWASGA